MAVEIHPDMYDTKGNLLRHGLCMAPGAKMTVKSGGETVNMRDELMKCNNIGTLVAVDGTIHVRQEVADMIWKYISMGGYGGMELHDFLDKTFSGD